MTTVSRVRKLRIHQFEIRFESIGGLGAHAAGQIVASAAVLHMGLNGTIRREYLDHVPFWNAKDLERKLLCFQDYYNRERAHQGLSGKIPDPRLDNESRKIAHLGDYRWKSCCRGLFQLPAAA